MSERVEKGRVTPSGQARYRYLADFSKQQHSPNLRKQYQEQYEKLSNSLSGHNSHERRRSIRRYQYQRQNQYSPPCSTFNPKRQQSQQQFSPYEERIEIYRQNYLSKQLMDENAALRNQLTQSQQNLQKIKNELNTKNLQILKLRQKSQSDLIYYERIVSQMKGEIQITLTKNKMLQDELFVVRTRVQEEFNRRVVEEERRRLEEKRFRDDQKRLSIPLFERVGLNNLPESTKNTKAKRSVGKLLNKSINNTFDQSKQNSKIKIQDEGYEQEGKIQKEDKKNEQKGDQKQNKRENESRKEKQVNKYEQLIESIRTMYGKIANQQAKSLKQLWKWLKGVGYSYSCLKKWKKKVQKYQEGYLSLQKLKELITEACQHID